MNLLIQTRAEAKKLRRRRLPLLFFMVFLLIAAWILWCLDDLDTSRLNDVGAMLYINLLLMNTILSPVVLAAAPAACAIWSRREAPTNGSAPWNVRRIYTAENACRRSLRPALCPGPDPAPCASSDHIWGQRFGICTPFFMSLLVYFLALFTLQLGLSCAFPTN